MSSGTRSLRKTMTKVQSGTTATARRVSLNRKAPAGVAFPVCPPSVEAYQRFVLQGICPYCGRGPFKVLAGHTVRAHAVDKRDLCDNAGLMYSTPITSPEYHEKRSEIAKALYPEGLAKNDSPKSKTRNISLAAKAKSVEKIMAARDTDAYNAGNAERRRKELERIQNECELVVVAYDEAVEELGYDYGAYKVVSERLGIPMHIVTRRCKDAWAQNLGRHRNSKWLKVQQKELDNTEVNL